MRIPTDHEDWLEVMHLGGASSLTAGFLVGILLAVCGGSGWTFLAGLTLYMWVAYGALVLRRRRHPRKGMLG